MHNNVRYALAYRMWKSSETAADIDNTNNSSEVVTEEVTTRDVHPYDITLTFTGDINLAEGEPTTKELDKMMEI